MYPADNGAAHEKTHKNARHAEPSAIVLLVADTFPNNEHGSHKHQHKHCGTKIGDILGSAVRWLQMGRHRPVGAVSPVTSARFSQRVFALSKMIHACAICVCAPLLYRLEMVQKRVSLLIRSGAREPARLTSAFYSFWSCNKKLLMNVKALVFIRCVLLSIHFSRFANSGSDENWLGSFPYGRPCPRFLVLSSIHDVFARAHSLSLSVSLEISLMQGF